MVLGAVGMYFTNALYDPSPVKGEAAAAAAAAAAQQNSYGATDSGGVLAPPAPQVADFGSERLGSDACAPSGACVRRARLACSAHARPPHHPPRRPTLEELTAALDIQDAPFVPPRFEPWRFMERIIANCAAVFIWVVRRAACACQARAAAKR